MKTLVLYDSLSGNTEKVANTILGAAGKKNITCDMIKVDKETALDFFDYNLVFAGSPVIDWLPTQTMIDFIKKRLKAYNRSGLVKPSAPIVPGKFAVCFGTFAGPHIGKREALPMTMWLRSFFEHIGFIVLDEWHLVGRFKGREDLNRDGRYGDIRNRPDNADLLHLENRVYGLLASLEAWRT